MFVLTSYGKKEARDKNQETRLLCALGIAADTGLVTNACAV